MTKPSEYVKTAESAEILGVAPERDNPIDEQTESLQEAIAKLVKARELLLPRLMNGEIAV